MNIYQRRRAYQVFAQPLPPAYESEWHTTTTNETITLPLISSGTYNFYVDWGDGNTDTITAYNQSAVTHTYATSGTRYVVIRGVINGWKFNNGGSCNKIYNISNWGPLTVTDRDAFNGCSNLTITATDSMNTSGTTLQSCFQGCSSLVSGPNVSFNSITKLTNFFNGCSSLVTIPDYAPSSANNFFGFAAGCPNLVNLGHVDISGVSNTTYLSGLVDPTSTLSTTSYSSFLNYLDTLTLNFNNYTFEFGIHTKYNSSAISARANLLANYNLSFNDGGLE